MHQQSTALIGLNPSLTSLGFSNLLNNLKIFPSRTQINTKESIISEVEDQKPNILFISSSLPGVIDIAEVISKAKQVSPRTKIILVINDTDTGRILNYLVANVDAVIWSDNFVESIESAIKQTLKEQLFICGRSAFELRRLLVEQKSELKNDVGLLSLLTDREVEVLHSLTQGVNYKQISKLLFISESTVKTHINNIFTKLSVNDRTQAVLYALKHGIENIAKKPDLLKNLTNQPVQK